MSDIFFRKIAFNSTNVQHLYCGPHVVIHNDGWPDGMKVALRIRPLSKKETEQSCSECLSAIPDTTQILIGTDRSFTFDYVFPSDAEQEDVFQECAKPLLDKLVEGYNVTILAYGQTGSGKTYSMGTTLGADIKPEHMGIVPRAINHLFSDLAERKAKNPAYEYEVLVSFLELYNEDLIDLLNPQSREGGKKGKSELMIREDANGQIYWAGVKEVPVSSPEDLFAQLAKGSLARTVAYTDMNAVSSRSHAIFSVILKQTKIENPEENKENDPQAAAAADSSSKKSKKPKSLTAKITSKFHFVDLAGSERLKRTNASGDRAKEGIAINGGLLALGNVISALGDESRKVTHIPYRDSKLTRLLQDSLGGNSQTLMLACVSPADSNFMETLNTLKYANRARNIKNKVSVNESYGGNSIEINQLRGQISRLKLEIQTLRSNGLDEEATRKYEEEVKSLKNELGVVKMKLQAAEQQVIMANTEKNSLLMDIHFNRQDLSESERAHHMKTHHIIQSYEQQIMDYKNQVAELQGQVQTLTVPRKSSFAGSTPGKEKGHIKFYDELLANNKNNSEDEGRNNESDDGGKKSKKKKKRSKKLKARASGHFPISEESPSFNGQLPSEPPSSEQHMNIAHNLEEAKNMFSHIGEEGEEIDGNQETRHSTDGNESDRPRRRLKRHRESLERVKEQVKQLFNLKDDDPILCQMINTPSSTKSESHIDQMLLNHMNAKEGKRRSSSVSFSEIQTIEVPSWDDSNHQATTQSSNRRGSNSSRSVSFSEQISPSSTKSSSQNSTGGSSQQNAVAFTRMLHQIRSDIAVKEQLVNQLEKVEAEFTYMRAEYEQRLAQMQENLIALQHERDAAVKRAASAGTGISTRDKHSILVELKARYEHKMKHLIQEIGDLRRKYNEATQMNTTAKSQNETMIKSLKAQIEQLKADKMRIIKRMKEDSDRFREAIERNQIEIQTLRRKEKNSQEVRRRLERTNELQKIMLEKKQHEAIESAGKLKSVMTLLKKTSSSKAIAKAFRGKRRVSVKKESPSRSGSDDFSNIFEDIFGSGFDKKKALDDVIEKHISNSQQASLIDELLEKRDKLLKDKQEIIIAREAVSDGSPEALVMDEDIESVNSEISYVNAKIRALQADFARNSTEQQVENDAVQPEEKHHSTSGKTGKERKRSLPDNPYDVAVSILRNLDGLESQTILESFFEDIVKLRACDRSKQMTLAHQERNIVDLRNTVLAMRKAIILTTSEYEKRNRDLEEKLRHLTGRSSNPSSPKDEMSTLFDRFYETTRAEVVTQNAVSTPGPLENTPSSRRNSYFVEAETAALYSSPVEIAPVDVPSQISSAIRSRPPIPEGWLTLQPREKEVAAETATKTQPTSPGASSKAAKGENRNSVGSSHSLNRTGSSGRRLKRPPSLVGPISPKEDFGETPRTPTTERTNKSIQHVKQSSTRRSSLRDTPSHSRNNSSNVESYGDSTHESPRDSGYFSSADKHGSMVRQGSKELSHTRQTSSPDFDDNASVTSEHRGQHAHTRSETPTEGNVYDRLSRSHTHSSSAKSTPTKKALKEYGAKGGHVKQNSGGVNAALAALEGKRDEYGASISEQVEII
ncbi:13398_t:CDS:2 [Acaulospora colombiana]|uniref:13398_t:CDS:1 n=1 Tax=Acaulospora colombiana TaxID=27376 RepID=A0ACA9JY61_9GLOM|nr:13398_t:CDS:2 [Acaulospora colombiana]